MNQPTQDSARRSGRPGSVRSVVSTASTTRRPPSALRSFSNNPRAMRAHANVTLVFATGDPSLPLPPSGPQGLRRAVSGASPVEEALSRQLDRDMAGQHLGLRSRRSSAATLASMRTDYTHHGLVPTTEEEEAVIMPRRRDSQSSHGGSLASTQPPPPLSTSASTSRSPEQQPSSSTTPPPTDITSPSTPPPRRHPDLLSVAPSADPSVGPTPQVTPNRRASLNPKQSSAWLRWSSPAPSFPKKDKGKAREEPAAAANDTAEDTSVTPTASAHATVTARQHQRTSSTSSAAPPAPSTDTKPPPAQPPHPPAPQMSSGKPGRRPGPVTAQATTSAHQSDANTGVSSSNPNRAHEDVTPTQSKLHASVSSTVRSEEGDVSALLDDSTIRKVTMESESTSNRPDPSLELPPPSIRGWRIPFWGSSEPTSSVTPVRAPIPKDLKPAVATSDTAERNPSEPPAVAAATTEPPAAPAPSDVTPGKPELKSPTSPKAKAGSREAIVPNGPSKTNGNGNATDSAKRRKVAESVKATARDVVEPAAVAVVPNQPAKPKLETLEISAGEHAELSGEQGALVPAGQVVGWSSYLVSFVYNSQPTPITPATAAKETADKEAEPATPLTAEPAPMEPGSPAGPTADQLLMPPPPLAPPIALDQPISLASGRPPKVAAGATCTPGQSEPPSPSLQPRLASSTSSTGGWLSYLAFRASQKKITGSTVSGGQNEEVMDFSADPDFPSTEPPADAAMASAAPAPTDVKGKTKQAVPERKDSKGPEKKDSQPPSVKGVPAPSSIKGKTDREPPAPASLAPESKAAAAGKQLTHKRSQNLALSARRQSNASSVRSGGGVIPPPSPRQLVGAKASSSLPPPPQAPSKQPNLIIPTFETSFDRPPRSLMPRTAQDGMTATAWRALSYVYNTSKDPVGETRGLKKGRDVGSNLPRRIGLGGVGTPDDGWKNVRRVVVVGVHGWFPAKLLNSVIGEPTGTSVKFANMMGEAVKKFFKEKGVDDSDIRLTLIPLEGEGVIDDRVDKLYKAYLSNPAWINDLRRADAILFAAHSQGCIVTTHLISRMIAQGHIRTGQNRDAVARCEWAFGPIAIVPSEDSKRGRKLAAGLSGAEGGRQKVIMLAMCGVHLGPFLSISTSSVIGPYLTWFENAAARELFEFQDTQSAVSQAYQRSLAMILDNEVRVLLLASLNDQVVPIYGASFSAATHPLLLRALYVDGASYSQSDFMTNLICFAFMLRNAGIDDQRLVEHLSEATAGSLTGVGHSTPYEELGCYSLAVHCLFHTGPAAQPLPPLQVDAFAARDARNDFELPWIMRALVDAPEVKDLFPDELRDLKDSIVAWKPLTRPLKEIKKRLEPMAGRARLAVKHTSHLAHSSSSTSLASMAADHAPPHPHAHSSHLTTHNTPAPSQTNSPLPPGKKPQSRLSSSSKSNWAENQALGTRR